MDQLGRRIKGAAVTLTSADGGVRTAVTDSNGFYAFDDVPLGEIYVIRASERRYRFTPESIEYTHIGQSSDQNFTGITR
jgi:hypothetical protein